MQPLIHRTVRALLAASFVAAISGCTGEVAKDGTGKNGGDEIEMAGAGGRDISEYWPTIDVPLSQNTRMLSYEMLKSEVTRATGIGWTVAGVDQWTRNRGALGGADFVTTFADDITPSQQRIVLIRKMAFQVCGNLVEAEAGQATRTVFTTVDPGVAIDAAAAATKTQIRSLFRRFFLADATDTDVAEGEALLKTLSPTGAEARVAWRGLCAAYLGSMRFLTY